MLKLIISCIPALGIFWRIGGNRFTLCNNFARLPDAFNRSACDKLHGQIAEHRCLNGACEHWHTTGIGRHLAEKAILRAAAEDMDLPVGLAGAVPDRLKGQAVFEREALIDAAHDFANRLRDILPRFFTEFPHPARQVAAGRILARPDQ